jgi:hypothetical protein
MHRHSRVFTPEHLTVMQRACQRICSQRRYPAGGIEAKRIALKAMALFASGYTREASLVRALRHDA